MKARGVREVMVDDERENKGKLIQGWRCERTGMPLQRSFDGRKSQKETLARLTIIKN